MTLSGDLARRKARSRKLSETLIDRHIDLRADRPRLCERADRAALGRGRRAADRVRVHAGDPAASLRHAGDGGFSWRVALADLGRLFHSLRHRLDFVARDDHARLRPRQPGGDRRRRLRRLFQRRADRHSADAGGARRSRHALPDRHRRRASADHDAGQRLPERMDAATGEIGERRRIAPRGLSTPRDLARDASDPDRRPLRASSGG